MLQFTPFIGYAYYGRRAGDELENRIENARQSIKIVSPYLSQALIDLLLIKADQGVDVTLVTSSEIEKQGLNIYRNFIKQNRTTDEAALKHFNRVSGVCVAALILFSLAFIARLFLGVIFPGFSYVVLALFGGLIIAGYYRKRIRTFSYSYSTPFRFKAVASPNTDKHLMKDPRCALIHSKIFIIDGALYTGSVNFTQSAFWYNHECLFTSTDPPTVNHADSVIEGFFRTDYFYARTPEGIGRLIYPERVNPIF